MHVRSLVLVLALLGSRPASAQYNAAAALSVPPKVPVQRTFKDEEGRQRTETVMAPPPADAHGNARGNQYDLARDGAFKGQTIAVLQFYDGFDFSLPRAALAEKGFSVYRWSNAAPSPEELKQALAKANQLWIISGDSQHLNDRHLAVIKAFFDAGHGVYIWGDNPPYTSDANFVANSLLHATMTSDAQEMGAQTVGLQRYHNGVGSGPGIRPNHLLTTGLEHLYEGITIATLLPNQTLQNIVYGSAGKPVVGSYDHDRKRAILDGGFTRLYVSWDEAGTARYVKNAAAWLANAERFGKAVVASQGR